MSLKEARLLTLPPISFRFYSSRPGPPISPCLDDAPHITIIRPVKGLEPGLRDCIASTFRLAYPKEKLTIYLCISENSDPAYSVLKKIVDDFPEFDAKVLVEKDDPFLHGSHGHVDNLGPNPKIRNISRAYREAKGDLIWIIDCNVWVGSGVAGRMVDKLLGLGPPGVARTPYKFVHHLPMVVDMDKWLQTGRQSWTSTLLDRGGGRLDEMFMATTHAKFYGAINTVGIAPCIVGKSNMFRKSHLDKLTRPSQNAILLKEKPLPMGIDYFSFFICEDHLIGDLLWRSNMPGLANHGLVLGDLAIQPMEGVSVGAYIARRVRWLRARKWTVIAATLVEPGVESLLCNTYFSFALTTIPWFNEKLGMPQTWTAMLLAWFAGVLVWMTVDWFTFCRMHAGLSVEVDEQTPLFARGTGSPDGVPRRPLKEWVLAWVGREVLALPIWTWAVLLGTTVTWRGKTFNVRMDMRVVEIGNASTGAINGAAVNSKDA